MVEGDEALGRAPDCVAWLRGASPCHVAAHPHAPTPRQSSPTSRSTRGGRGEVIAGELGTDTKPMRAVMHRLIDNRKVRTMATGGRCSNIPPEDQARSLAHAAILAGEPRGEEGTEAGLGMRIQMQLVARLPAEVSESLLRQGGTGSLQALPTTVKGSGHECS